MSTIIDRYLHLSPEREAELEAAEAEREAERRKLDQWAKEELLRGRVAQLIAEVGERYQACTLDNYECYHAEQRAVVAKLRAYQSEIGYRIERCHGLVLCGSYGTGKDHLLIALLFAAVKQGRSVKYMLAEEFWAEVRDQIEEGGRELEFARRFAAIDVLALSDLTPASGPLTPAQMRKLHLVVDKRYHRMRPTWITTNATSAADAAARIGGGVLSRITESGGVVLQCNWPSYRSRKKGVDETVCMRDDETVNGGGA